MSTMVKPALAVAKDQSVHVVGCPALKGSPRCTCPHPKDQKQAGKPMKNYESTTMSTKSHD